MQIRTYRLIYLITLLSGAAGLIYEITWTRMLVLVFGNSTHSIVAVISAFLGGLAVGSFLIGSWCDKKTPVQLLRVYLFIEFGIGILAALTILLLPFSSHIYSFFSDGSTLTRSLLIIKFLLTTAVILLPTILIGGTLPILVSLLRYRFQLIEDKISLLYALNTFGAVLGVIISAFISIELLGLTKTIFIGVSLNFLAGLFIFLVPIKSLQNRIESQFNPLKLVHLSPKERIILVCFFASGLISIAYEVLWTRVLTPITGTFVYAFAFILAIYLLGISVGSILYNKVSRIYNKNLIFALSEVGIGFFALISVFLVSSYKDAILPLILPVILPASIFMGLSFPAAIGLVGRSTNHGRIIGTGYFSNTTGSIIGGFVVSFIFIPLIGSTQSIILFALGNFLLALILIFLEMKHIQNFQRLFLLSTVVMLIFATVWLLIFKRNDLYDATTKKWLAFATHNQAQIIHKEDDVASVIGIQGKENYMSTLLVDGVVITLKVIETRLMAHLPIALHSDPKSILIIGFGMGSTYHSALLHKIDVDAVELSPSVASMFSLFYSDANNLLKDAKGRIIINDGRNYVNLTNKKYDIITIDPPPPFNAAGTTVLYSEDFYKSMLRILNPGGLVMQWVPPASRKDDSQMVVKSFINVFPYAIAIKTPGEENGSFLVGSISPILINKERINRIFSSTIVRDDLIEFHKRIDTDILLDLITDREDLVSQTQNVLPVTDDRPRTEYFGLRHLFTISK